MNHGLRKYKQSLEGCLRPTRIKYTSHYMYCIQDTQHNLKFIETRPAEN